MIERTIFNPFLKKIIARVIKRSIKRRFGCDCNVTFEQLDIASDETCTTIKLDGKMTVMNKDFDYLLKNLV